MIDRFNTGWGSIYEVQLPSVRELYLDGIFGNSTAIEELKRMQKETNMRSSNGIENSIVRKKFEYKKIIFNPPATIVLWQDGTKTVVKCGERDKFDKEKGIALCFMKRGLGNTSGALNKILHKEVRE